MRLEMFKTALCSAAVLGACAFSMPAAAATNFQFDGAIYYSDFGGLPSSTAFSAWGTYDESVAPFDGLYSFASMGGEFHFSILGQTFDMTDDSRWASNAGPRLDMDGDIPEFFDFQMEGADLVLPGGFYLGVYNEFGLFDEDYFSAAFGEYSLTRLEYVPSVESGIPEPASWLMMIMGFGLAGAAWRRRSVLQAA